MLGLFRVDTVLHRRPAECHTSFRVAEAQADTMVAWLRAPWNRAFPSAPRSNTGNSRRTHRTRMDARCSLFRVIR